MSFGVLLLPCLLLINIATYATGYDVPMARVAFYQNGGFEVSIPADPKISLFAFHGKINVELEGTEAGTWNMDIRKATGNRLVFVEPNVKFNLGDRLHYWIQVVYDGVAHDLLYQMEEVKKFSVRPAGLEKTVYEFTQPRIRFLNPRGFEVSIQAEDGVTLMAFHGQLNEPFMGRTGGTFSRDVHTVENGQFTFRERNAKLKAGDKLYFWIYVIYKGLGYHLEDQVYDYRGQEIQDHNIHFPNSEESTTGIDVRGIDATTTQCGTRISMTILNGERNVCSGAEIFFEDFKGNSLNTQKWGVERKIAGWPDLEFVLYSDEAISTGANGLRIEPKWLENVAGLRDYSVDNCTGPKDSRECRYIRRDGDLAPPVISSQISTAGRFSFLFGRVEIEARLPRGDWIFPQIWLQPQGFKYDKTDYKAGQIRVASIENSSNGGQAIVKQGILLGAEDPIRSAYLAERKLNSLPGNWDKEFHKFVMEWKPEGITFWMDNERNVIGNWRNSTMDIPGSQLWRLSSNPAAPFDQEFYLTLGVGVGGRNDFSTTTTPWDRTSPQQRREFYKAKDNWWPSWTPETKALEVRSVRVFAL